MRTITYYYCCSIDRMFYEIFVVYLYFIRLMEISKRFLMWNLQSIEGFRDFRKAFLFFCIFINIDYDMWPTHMFVICECNCDEMWVWRMILTYDMWVTFDMWVLLWHMSDICGCYLWVWLWPWMGRVKYLVNYI